LTIEYDYAKLKNGSCFINLNLLLEVEMELIKIFGVRQIDSWRPAKKAGRAKNRAWLEL